MIQLDKFSTGYKDCTLLADVTTRIESGRLTALIGRNGTGKSTLLRCIAGLNNRYHGTITVDGRNVASTPPHIMARMIALVTTERPRIPSLTCHDVVATGRAPYTGWTGRLTAADRRAITMALDTVGMQSYSNRSLDTMSDGECQRVMIARALAQETPVILLDEPTSFLDMPTRYELCALLQRLAGEGRCILFSTHELDIAMKLSDDIALLHDSSLIVLPAREMARTPLLKHLIPDMEF